MVFKSVGTTKLKRNQFLKKGAKLAIHTMFTLEKQNPTLKSPIEEHARLDFSDFLSTLFAIFHVINEKFHPARLLIYLVKKQAG